MICEDVFVSIMERAKEYKYSSLNYVDFDECENAEILCNNDVMILLKDRSKSPTMLYFATDNFEEVIKQLAKMGDKLRLHFVPRVYAEKLEELGFSEWGEYVDFWNVDLVKTAEKIEKLDEIEYLRITECEEASAVTRSCMLQSRGFEGDTPESYEEWLNAGNHVIIQRSDSVIAGICCVTIYNEGTTLWIKEVAVAPKHQGIGLGKKLIEQAISYGVGNGATKGFLLADLLNENAIGLYQKYNFHAKETEGELQMVKD